jgi:nucleoside-diphosphate-sugar epimerase
VFGSSYYGETPGGARADETMSPRRPIGNGPIFEPCVEALRAAGARGLSWAAAFVGGVYGPGSWFLGMYADAIRRRAPVLVREPSPIWPYIHVDDCARAIEHLARIDDRRLAAEGREVIVVDDEPAPMVEFIERLADRMGEPAQIEKLAPEALRARVDPLTFVLNTDMAHSNERLRRLGFACRYPHVREGLASLPAVS